MQRPKVAGYVLAGGRSSRMGQDKAMLLFDGETLLRRAVSTVRGVSDRVAVIGNRTKLEGADYAVPDRHQGCGPLGGMDAALHDLISNQMLAEYDWACFLPVDMPLLPPDLYQALMHHWLDRADEPMKVAYVIVDGTPQPLVSLVHRSASTHIAEAVQERRLKVTSVFDDLDPSIASPTTAGVASRNGMEKAECGLLVKSHLIKTIVFTDGCHFNGVAWSPEPTALADRTRWFDNINRPQELEAIRNLRQGPGFDRPGTGN